MATQDNYIRTALRVPPDLHAKIHESAKQNNRTFNAELVSRLERSFSSDRDMEEHAFESAVETTTLSNEVARLTALLQKANESKASPSPSADEIADKVAERLRATVLEKPEQAVPDCAKPRSPR